MTEEQLIFTAGDAAQKAYDLANRMWANPSLNRTQAAELASLGRTLSCAATELENRARGLTEQTFKP